MSSVTLQNTTEKVAETQLDASNILITSDPRTNVVSKMRYVLSSDKQTSWKLEATDDNGATDDNETTSKNGATDDDETTSKSGNGETDDNWPGISNDNGTADTWLDAIDDNKAP